MRILFISDYEISSIAGGIEKVVHTLSREFMQRGIKCYSAYYEFKGVGKTSVFDSTVQISDTDCLISFIREQKIDVIITALAKKKNFVPLMPKLYDATRGLNCRVIYGYYNMPGYELAGKMDIDLFRYRLKCGGDIKNSILTFGVSCVSRSFLNVLMRYFIGHKLFYGTKSDMIYVLSSHYIEPYKKLVGNYSDTPFMAIGNPLSFVQEECRINLSEKEKIVINVSRFDVVHKCQNDLLDIWREIENDAAYDDWKLLLVGYGQDELFLKGYAAELDLKRVEFVGVCDPRKLYEKASIYALTSAFEGLPMVLLDAEQYGVVPVSVDSYAAVHDIIQDNQNGFIVKYGNKTDFVRCLKELMSDAEKRNAMSVKCLDAINKFDKDIIVNEWISNLQRLISN